MIRLLAALSVSALLFVGFIGAGVFTAVMAADKLKTGGAWNAILTIGGTLIAVALAGLFGIIGPYELYWKKERKHVRETANIIFGVIAFMAIGATAFGNTPIEGAAVWITGAAIGYWATLQPINWQRIQKQLGYGVAVLSILTLVVGIISITFGILNKPDHYGGRRLVELARLWVEPNSIEREFLVSSIAIVVGAGLTIIALASTAALFLRRTRARDA